MNRLRAFLLVGMVVALSACSFTSTRLVGWYVTRQIDHYLDLTSAQKEQLRPHVDAEVDRARREDLPHWVSLLRSIRDLTEHGPSDEGAAAVQRRYDTLLDAGVANLAPKFAPLLAELDAEQRAHFQRRLLEFVDKTLPEQKLPPEQRRAKQDENMIEGIEKIAGDLSEEQERKLLTRMHEAPDDRPLRYQNDRRRVYSFIKFLATKPGAPAIEAELKRLWVTRFDALGPGFDLTSRRALQRKQLIALHGLLTPEQRAHAVEHLTEQITSIKRWLLPNS